MVQTGLLESPFRSALIVVGPPRVASKRLRNLPGMRRAVRSPRKRFAALAGDRSHVPTTTERRV